MDDNAYCASQVRAFDSDRFVTALFAPASRRDDLIALYAFNLELARSREMVSEPALGQIRLQWWRDAVAECYEGRARRHQVVQPLAAAIERHGLSRELLDRIIDAREADFDPSPPSDTDSLVAYAQNSSGALNRLALTILGVEEENAQQAAMAVGTAWVLAGTARGLRHLLMTGRRPLPSDLTEKHGLSHARLESLKPEKEVRNVVEELSSMALKTMGKKIRVPNGLAPVMLQSVLIRGYLKRLASTGYNPFDERNLRPLSYRTWRLIMAAMTGRM
jgi:NADH dehydrogenase [ubiquinone] 1 alpha subcomplex assembly factor 6